MAFVNASLLVGTLLIGIPIALHLMMRQKPKHLVFPALRFVRKKQESNRRTLRLRQWLLLLLRCLVVALAALALARPSVTSASFSNWLTIAGLVFVAALLGLLLAVGIATGRSRAIVVPLALGELAAVVLLIVLLVQVLRTGSGAMIGDREAPVAAVIIIDSSPRMQYRYQNQTRLEAAQATGQWLLGQLPRDSKVAILDSRALAPVFSIDLAAARKMIERVVPTGAPRPLPQLLIRALQLVETTPLTRKELYVVTDQTRRAWRADEGETLRAKLADSPDVALYLIDVGVTEPQNLSLAPPVLADEVVPENGMLRIRTAVTGVRMGGPHMVELELETPDPTLPVVRDDKVVLPKRTVRARRELNLAEGESVRVEFQVPDLPLGVQHGLIRLVGQDALTVDDVRYFTVDVRPPRLVLVVAAPGVNSAAFVEAISPLELRTEHRVAYECLVVQPEDLGQQHLGDFAALVLLDPPPLVDLVWDSISQYVRAGGNLCVFLGRRAGRADVFNVTSAQSVMPGKLGREYRVTGRDMFLAPRRYDHPILAAFREIASTVPWNQFPIYRHWSLRDLAADTRVVLRFGNGQPAILERPLGSGLVVTMTTPITETQVSGGTRPWNELAGPDDWPRFVLVNQIMRYTTSHGLDQLNYRTGARVVLDNNETRDPRRYLLFGRNGEPEPIQARNGKIDIPALDAPGTYRLKGERGGPVARGFSANLPIEASDLTRATTERLDELLGAGRYKLARDRQQIERVQGRQRAGREFFPLLVLALALLLLLEYLLANRFYAQPQRTAPT